MVLVKNTIAKLIIGLLEPKTGDIKVDGIHLDEEHLYDVRREKSRYCIPKS